MRATLVQRWAELALRASKNPVVGRPIALGWSLAKTLRTGRLHLFWPHRTAGWTNRQRGVVFFAPALHTMSLDVLRARVADYWCRDVVPGPGQVVVDVGAGVGDETLVFSEWVGPRGVVVAIEAHPDTFRCLALTCERNHLTNVVAVPEAAWNRETQLTITTGDSHLGNAVSANATGAKVRARRVDDILRDLALPAIDLLKVNIEGAEGVALAGMTETMARTRHVAVACHDFLATGADDPVRTMAHVSGVLAECGFTLSTRPDAVYPWVRHTVYGRREAPPPA